MAGEFVFKIDVDKIYDEDEELLCTIRDGKVYGAEDDEYMGTISEQNDRLIFNFYNDDKLKDSLEYDISTGFLLLETLG